MAINSINASLTTVSVSLTAQGMFAAHPQDSSPVKTKENGDSVATARSGGMQLAFNDLQNNKEVVNALAKSVRDVAKFIDKVADRLDKMADSLKEIVKNFPPFPPGNEDRLRLLKSYNSLRQQIDSMTFPPPPDFDGTRQALMGAKDPANASETFAISGSISISFEFRQLTASLSTLPDGSDGEASTAQVGEALTGLQAVSDKLAKHQSSLMAAFSKMWDDLPRFGTDNTTAVKSGSDIAVQEVAVSIRRELSFQMLGSFSGSDGRQILQNMFG
jgi:hypothetical protein